MTYFEDLMASLGIGAAHLTLRVPWSTYPRGAAADGQLTLFGGQVAQHIEALTLTLTEFWSENRTAHREPRASVVLARDLVVSPGDQITYPFSFLIPDDARLTNRMASAGWRVDADADIAWAVNPRASLPLTIVIHNELRAVQKALLALGFTETNWYVELFRPEHPDTVVKYYRGPEGLRAQIDGAALHLRVYDHWVIGRLILNRHQHNVAEQMKALVGLDRESHDLMFPRDTLLGENGAPRHEAAVEALRTILADALVLPGDAARSLLRAAMPPDPDGTTLLRPAGGRPTYRPNELLRPLAGPEEDDTVTR